MKLPFIKNSKGMSEPFKKGLLPSEEFLAQGKKNFLAAFDTSEFSRVPLDVPSRFTLIFKFGIGIMAVIAVVAGASAYADTANVSADSPLYPFKRLGEAVQLAVTPASQKAQVQAGFAVRRTDEITNLQINNPSSTLIPRLTNDLDRDISSSLASASTTNLKAGALGSLCKILTLHLGASILAHQDLLSRFNVQCDKVVSSTSSTGAFPIISTTTINIHLHGHRSSTWESSSTTTTFASTTVSTTVAVTSTVIIPPKLPVHISPVTLPKLPF